MKSWSPEVFDSQDGPVGQLLSCRKSEGVTSEPLSAMLGSSQTLNIDLSPHSVLGKLQRIISLIFILCLVFLLGTCGHTITFSSMQSNCPVQFRRNARKSSGVCVNRQLGIYSCCMAQCLCAVTAVFSSIFQVMRISQFERRLIWEES